MEQVKTTTQTSTNETFINASYNGMNILMRKSDGYINATQFCDQYYKRFRNLLRKEQWRDYLVEETKDLSSARIRAHGLIDEDTNKGYTNEYRGYYVHPNLINYIAAWICPKYAVYVRKIMDSINERILATHDETTSIQEHTEDTINMVIEEQKIAIEEYQNEIKSLKPRAVPKDKETSYILAIELEDEWQGKITYQ
ncbi:MAG: hypothetical protein EZS28_043514, partial [Streblomastix strix]